MCIDHVVIRCHTQSGILLEDALKFYQLLGFEPDREDEYRQQQADDAAGEDRKGIVFPSARLSPDTLIDLFPSELEPLFCETSVGQIDHMCLCYPSMSDHVAALERLNTAGVQLKKYGKPYGARGQGFSTYLVDPSGLYLELRNYEKERWADLEEWLKARNFMGAHPLTIPKTAPYKICGK